MNGPAPTFMKYVIISEFLNFKKKDVFENPFVKRYEIMKKLGETKIRRNYKTAKEKKAIKKNR